MYSSFLQSRSLPMIVAGIALGILITLGVNNLFMTQKAVPQAEPLSNASSNVLYWYDPMMPAEHFDKPGKSPFMDMELVPKYADEGVSINGLHVDPAQVQNLGMRKATVTSIPLESQIEVGGVLRFNERDMAVIQLRAGGFVEKIWPLAKGDSVVAGQPIVELLVPEWLTPQIELLSLKATNNPRLVNTTRMRLQLLGMPDALIAQVEKNNQPETRVVIRSPISGVIDTLEVRAGMTLASGQTLARINGLNTLWLDAAIPEAQAGPLHSGDLATFYPAWGSPIMGKLEYLLPTLNEATRTFTARILLVNTGGILQPGTTGRVVLQSMQAKVGIAIPTEAVIRTGKRVLVMVAESGGQFRPVNISIGSEIGDKTVITEGLTEGQEVVASGQFLLDSESSMLAIRPAPLPQAKEQQTTMSNGAELLAGLHQAKGQIVNLSAKEVGLKHSDFIELTNKKVSMPAMTMTFPLANETVAKDFKAGDWVGISARKVDGMFVIEKMEIDKSHDKEIQP